MSAMGGKLPLLFLVRTNSCPSNEKQTEQIENDCANDDCEAGQVTLGLRRALFEAIAGLRSEQQEPRKKPD